VPAHPADVCSLGRAKYAFWVILSDAEMRKTALGIALVLVFLAATCLTLPYPANAAPRTIVVPDDAPTITAALGYALNGDTILVKSGNYSGSTIVIDKSVTLMGEDANTTVIVNTDVYPWDLSWPPPPPTVAVQISADKVKISGFTITDASANIAGNANHVQISNNIIPNGYVQLDGKYNSIINNTIQTYVECLGSNNNVSTNTVLGTNIILKGSFNTVSNNCLPRGGYITLQGTLNPYLTNDYNLILNNTLDGGGVLIEKGSSNIVYENRINEGAGMLLYIGNNNVFRENHLTNNYRGALIGGSGGNGPWVSGNALFHNNFVNNTRQVDTDYPSYGNNNFDKDGEGNYWSDYTGIDANNDGIGDTPYVIDETRRDNRPLMFPWGEWEFSVSLPQNRSYSGSVPLVFVADRPTEWFSYSLDGLDNVTVAGNTTLTGLIEGWHTITVYANDTLGNAGTSETISFLVDTQTALFQTLLVAVAVVAVAVVAGAGLLLYHRKRRKEAQQT